MSSTETVFATSRGERLPEGLKWVTVNGVKLPYVERGTGQPVVLVHGGISDLTAWDPILGQVARGYRAISYSRRYAWPGEPIPEGVLDHMQPHVDDLIALVENLRLGQVHLVGNSWGGFVCLLTALKRSDLVRSLVVQEPPVLPLFFSFPPKPWELLAVLVSRPRTGKALLNMIQRAVLPSVAALKPNELEDGVRIFVRNGAWGPAAYASMPDEVMRHMLLDARTFRAQMLGNTFPRFTPADARAIRVPTLVMTGAISPVHMHCLADRLAELLPNIERVEVPEASHMMHWQNPDATAQAILGFVGRHAAE
jgi:pimeloyl-ACP methyl ester carboxylesterase